MTSSVRERHVVVPVHRAIRMRSQCAAEAAEISSAFQLSDVAARILSARGFRADERLKHYISPTLKEGMPDPSLLKNLDAACELLADFIARGRPIAICCDFDVDGLSGGSQLLGLLLSLGVPAKVFVPDRFTEGYGLNAHTVEEIAAAGFELLISVDFGTTNEAELTLAKKRGLKTIVIDHHEVGSHRSPADVFINPTQSGCGFAEKSLCAAGLVWFLLVGLRRRLPTEKSFDVREYLDLACLGTICDMVPLVGVNRIIAKRGLEVLHRTQRAGLKALKDVMGVRGVVNCADISFGLGPRLNAAGRMVHGELVAKLLTTKDVPEAQSIAATLNRLNVERQEVESEVKENAVLQLKRRGELPRGIVVWDEEFHTGVIGIVAQRLVEQYYRPSVVLGADKEGIYKGSVRGVRGFNVIEALTALGDHLLKFGGHAGAGGFSIEAERLEEFREAWEAESDKRLKGLDTEPYVDADTEIGLGEVTLPLVDELRGLAPFGIGNPSPVVLLRKLKVTDVRILKGAHLKVRLSDSTRSIDGLMWKQTGHPALNIGSFVDVAARPDSSVFGGTTQLQLNLQAVQAA